MTGVCRLAWDCSSAQGFFDLFRLSGRVFKKFGVLMFSEWVSCFSWTHWKLRLGWGCAGSPRFRALRSGWNIRGNQCIEGLIHFLSCVFYSLLIWPVSSFIYEPKTFGFSSSMALVHPKHFEGFWVWYTHAHGAFTDQGDACFRSIENSGLDHHLHGLLQCFSLDESTIDDLHGRGGFTTSQFLRSRSGWEHTQGNW